MFEVAAKFFTEMDSSQNHSLPAVNDIPPESLHEALLNVFRPVIQELDVCVENARNSQQDVKRQIEALGEEIHQISTICDPSPTLDVYAKKVVTIKRRVTVMYNILQNVQERLKKIEQTAASKPMTTVPVTSIPPVAPVLPTLDIPPETIPVKSHDLVEEQ